MERNEAKNFLMQYVDNDCYTDKCRNAHKLACEALKDAHWENITETVISDVRSGIVKTTETCSCCHKISSFLGKKTTLDDAYCPRCGAFMKGR